MTVDEKFGQDLLATIKKEELTPKPRWHFVLKDSFIWALGGVCLMVGALAAAVIFHLLRGDWFTLTHWHHGDWPEFLLLSLPYFWLVLSLGFLNLVYLNIKHTKKGYRYPLWLLALVVLSASLILGVIFQALGWGAVVDEVLSQGAPFYEEVFNPRARWWLNPEEGRLGGVVVAKNKETEYVLLAPQKQEWLVKVAIDDERDASFLQVGLPVNLLGKMESAGVFIAEKVLPPQAGRGFFEKGGKELFGLPCGEEREEAWQYFLTEHPKMETMLKQATVNFGTERKVMPAPWICDEGAERKKF